MKASVLPLAAFAALLLASPASRADISHISIRVEATSKSEPDKTDHYTIKQDHSLKVQVSNSSKDASSVKLKYIFFGRNLQDHKIDKINEGEKEAPVNPMATATVEIPAVSSTYTEEHYPVSAGGKGGGGKGGKAKKVEASGSRYVGYSVQAFEGEKMVAEAYDPAGMKDEVSKAAVAAKGDEIKAGAAKGAKK